MNTLMVLTNPLDYELTREAWIEEKEAELAEAKTIAQSYALINPEATPRQVKRVKEKVKFLEKFLETIKAGYIPIPRFDSRHIDYSETPMPAHALMNIKTARESGVFDEIRIVEGREGQRMGPYPALRKRDPLIVGIIKYGPITEQWAYEEHFLIAWWRPESFKPTELY